MTWYMYIEKVDVLHTLLQNILLERSLKKYDFSKPSLCHGWCDKRHASPECFSAQMGRRSSPRSPNGTDRGGGEPEGGLAFCLSFQAVWDLWRLRMTSLKWFWISICCLRYDASRTRVLWPTADNNAISIKVKEQAVDNFDTAHRWLTTFSKISSFQELLIACNGVFFNHHISQILPTSGTNKAS